MTKTIAILGAGNTLGSAIAHELAGSENFLLLMDKQLERVESLRQILLARYPLATIEVATCAYESAWEADRIILALNEQNLIELAQTIREVVTGKRVICVVPDKPALVGAGQEPTVNCGVEELKAALPYTEVIMASLVDFRQNGKAVVDC